MQSTTIGIDLAKSVFQISVANHNHRIIKRQRLTRPQFERFLVHTPPSRLVMEGCASAHHWARVAQTQGHHPQLLHARYVKAYVRRHKTDAGDADALVRAATDPDLKPIAIKSTHQQALQSLHRIRAQWLATRVARINEARGVLAEFGVVLPRGTRDIGARLHAVVEQLPQLLHFAFTALIAEIGELKTKLTQLDHDLKNIVTNDPVGKRLLQIPGVGTTIASAALGRVGDIHQFPRARCFAAWLGLTPREYSSGHTRILGRISRQGDNYLRMLLIHGARSALLAAKRLNSKGQKLTELQHWVVSLEQRVGHNKATVALANKMARILWAVWTKNATFNGDHAKRYH